MFQQLKAKGQLTIRVNYLMRIFDYFERREDARDDRLVERQGPTRATEWGLRIGGE